MGDRKLTWKSSGGVSTTCWDNIPPWSSWTWQVSRAVLIHTILLPQILKCQNYRCTPLHFVRLALMSVQNIRESFRWLQGMGCSRDDHFWLKDLVELVLRETRCGFPLGVDPQLKIRGKEQKWKKKKKVLVKTGPLGNVLSNKTARF